MNRNSLQMFPALNWRHSSGCLKCSTSHAEQFPHHSAGHRNVQCSNKYDVLSCLETKIIPKKSNALMGKAGWCWIADVPSKCVSKSSQTWGVYNRKAYPHDVILWIVWPGYCVGSISMCTEIITTAEMTAISGFNCSCHYGLNISFLRSSYSFLRPDM